MRRFMATILAMIQRSCHGALLSIASSLLLLAMCYGVGFPAHSLIYAQQDSNAVLATRVEQLKSDQEDNKANVTALNSVVQDLRDRLNQMQGMLIGFGGFAALLQVLNTIVQFRGNKNGPR